MLRLSAASSAFPRPVSSFVGRARELERITKLFADETVFIVYGVAGVGKSELVYKAVDQLTRSGEWRDARRILLRAQPHFQIGHLVASMHAQVGAPTASVEPGPVGDDVDEDLARLAQALDASRSIVFIDDVHNLDIGEVTGALAYLSRYVRNSRVFVAARTALPHADYDASFVTLRLAPLSEQNTAEMVDQLALRLGIDSPDADAVFERAKGSPFFVQRALADSGGDEPLSEQSLDQSLVELDPDARRLLLLVAVLGEHIHLDALRRGFGEGADVDQLLEILTWRFLVDIDRDMAIVHALVRDAVVRVCGVEQTHAAHAAAAELYRERFAGDRERHHIDIITSIHHQLLAGEPDDAWRMIQHWYRAIAAAGLDHLIMEDLAALRDNLEEARWDIDLFRARVFVRRSRIADAQALLSGIRDDTVERSVRYLVLMGEVSQRAGNVPVARGYFQRARDAAANSTERFHSGLQLASVTAFTGQGDEARRLADEVLAELEWPSARHRGRWAWVVAMSLALQERHEQLIEVTTSVAGKLRGQKLPDLQARLMMWELLARVECDDVAGARELASSTELAAAAGSSLREHMTRLFLGFIHYASGDMAAACDSLTRPAAYFEHHQDQAYACMANYWLSRALNARGQMEQALDIVVTATQRAQQAGLASLISSGNAQRARVLAGMGRWQEVLSAASSVTADAQASARSLVTAHCASARAQVMLGQADDARSSLQTAREIAADIDALCHQVDLAAAEVEWFAGDVAAALELAQSSQRYYISVGRRYDEARARALHGLILATRGGPADVVDAERCAQAAGSLAAELALPRIASRVALIKASLAQQTGDASAARQVLIDAIADQTDETQPVEGQLVRLALQADPSAPAGVAVALTSVGFGQLPQYELVDRAGRQSLHQDDIDGVYASRGLIVDATRGVIVGPKGDRSVSNRPVTCRLLTTLVCAGERAIEAEELYKVVWGASEYHPLRHRNTIYVALNRLRKSLRELLADGDGNVIETTPAGWRIAKDVDACAIIYRRDDA